MGANYQHTYILAFAKQIRIKLRLKTKLKPPQHPKFFNQTFGFSDLFTIFAKELKKSSLTLQ